MTEKTPKTDQDLINDMTEDLEKIQQMIQRQRQIKTWKTLIQTIDRDPMTAVLRLQTMIQKKTGDPEVMVNLSDLTDLKDQIREKISDLETLINGENDNDPDQ